MLEQTVAGAKQRVEGQLTKEAFTYTTAPNAETLFADAACPLIDRTKANLPRCCEAHRPLGGQPGKPVAPTAALDLVPTGKPGQLKVVFHGARCPRPRWNWCPPPAGRVKPPAATTAPSPSPCPGRASTWPRSSTATKPWRGPGPEVRRGQPPHHAELCASQGVASPALPAGHAH